MVLHEKSAGSAGMGRVVRTAAVGALSLLLVSLLAAPANAASLFRVVTADQISRFCQQQGSSGAYLATNDAYGWRCSGGRGVDMDRLCSQPAGDPRFSRVANFYDPQRGWECWNSYGYVGRLGRADFTSYCQRFGYTGAVSGANAYSWRCSSPNRVDGVNVRQLCQQKLPGRVGVIDRFANFYDPNSWECRQ